MTEVNKNFISEFDQHLFSSGKHYELYKKLGAKVVAGGVHFSVWAPNAEYVSVVGDFNSWDKRHSPMHASSSGIWSCFISDLEVETRYKFFIKSKYNNYEVEKADPFAAYAEVRPKTASIVWNDEYQWQDHRWLKHRKEKDWLKSAVSIYEVHFGSWQRKVEEHNRPLTYREMASVLPGYVQEMGYTHVEFMPLTEFPLDDSWGYQSTGYFAPTSRYGSPADLKFLVDTLHQHNIGVILDWVPAHFPSDEHGLAYFDGTHLFEHADERKGYHPDWKTHIFNYGRTEVRQFLINSALNWLEEFHFDGLRVDAVASMIYLDYSREHGQWERNWLGGNENLEAISFLKEMNEILFARHSDILMIAEESTAFSGVSRPTYLGGLGFNLKWDMGWMNDTLLFLKRDPIHRKFHYHEITFRMVYAFTENYCVSLSHDEVVHGKGSLINKMPGDRWQKMANLRLLFSYMFSIPGKKLSFMGNEFAQNDEWKFSQSLDWHLLAWSEHQGIKKITQDLNSLYAQEKALHETDFLPQCFEFINYSDSENSVIAYARKSRDHKEEILVVVNFTPVTQHNYRVGVNHHGGEWKVIFNSDSEYYGGNSSGSFGTIHSNSIGAHGKEQSVNLNLPALGTLFLKWRE